MIGQKKLIASIDKFTLSTFPHSILMLGRQGSEQEDVCDYIAKKFDLAAFDLTETISKEFIDEIYDSHTLTLYTVDVNKIGPREQNILLKFYEEPNAYTYIILLAETSDNVLETILTRSYMVQMDKYDKEVLSGLVQNNDVELTLKCATTPGQIIVANHTKLADLYKMCNNMIDVLPRTPMFNVLTISDKINFKDEYDKYDLYLFLNVLSNCLIEKSVELPDYCAKFKNKLVFFNKYIWSMNDKKRYFEHLLFELHSISLQ